MAIINLNKELAKWKEENIKRKIGTKKQVEAAPGICIVPDPGKGVEMFNAAQPSGTAPTSTIAMGEDLDQRLPSNDTEFLSKLLGRMHADCEYFINTGMTNVKHLWAKNPKDQIELMRKIRTELINRGYETLLTEEDIDAYAKVMGINEKLEEDIEVHDELNPDLWEDDELIPEVREKIQEVADKFISIIAEDDIDFNVEDIIICGSNASYNYTKDSDIDVHILTEIKDNIYQKLFSAYKTLFNNKYDITIKGHEIEVYVDTPDSELKSNGIYSLKTGWVKHPERGTIPEVPDISVDFSEWEDLYNDIITDPTVEKIDRAINDIYDLRKESIAIDGEYGLGNLVFKEFRNRGYLGTLKQLKVDLESKELSLESLKLKEDYIPNLPEPKLLPHGSEEFKRLLDARDKLVDMFENIKDIRVQDTYFDFGQNWMWTTLVAEENDGDSWQMLSPREWGLLISDDPARRKLGMDDKIKNAKKYPDLYQFKESNELQEAAKSDDYRLPDVFGPRDKEYLRLKQAIKEFESIWPNRNEIDFRVDEDGCMDYNGYPWTTIVAVVYNPKYSIRENTWQLLSLKDWDMIISDNPKRHKAGIDNAIMHNYNLIEDDLKELREYRQGQETKKTEAIEKQGNYWVNKGKTKVHGKFRTKRAAREQQKAMFANKNLDEDIWESELEPIYNEIIDKSDNPNAANMVDRIATLTKSIDPENTGALDKFNQILRSLNFDKGVTAERLISLGALSVDDILDYVDLVNIDAIGNLNLSSQTGGNFLVDYLPKSLIAFTGIKNNGANIGPGEMYLALAYNNLAMTGAGDRGDLKSSEGPIEVKLSPGGAIDHATYFNRYTKLFEKCLPREERNYGYYALLPGDKFIPEDLIKDEISKFEELQDLRPVDGNYSWNEIFKHCAAERFNVYKEQEQFAHLIALTGNGNYVCIDNMLDAINSGIIEMKYAPYHGAMAFQIKSIRPM